MKNYQKFTILLTCISLIVSITFILQAYAKYVTSLEGVTSANIAKWNIRINDQLIKENKDLTNALEFEFEPNPHIAEDVFAPTSVRIFRT